MKSIHDLLSQLVEKTEDEFNDATREAVQFQIDDNTFLRLEQQLGPMFRDTSDVVARSLSSNPTGDGYETGDQDGRPTRG